MHADRTMIRHGASIDAALVQVGQEVTVNAEAIKQVACSMMEACECTSVGMHVAESITELQAGTSDASGKGTSRRAGEVRDAQLPGRQVTGRRLHTVEARQLVPLRVKDKVEIPPKNKARPCVSKAVEPGEHRLAHERRLVIPRTTVVKAAEGEGMPPPGHGKSQTSSITLMQGFPNTQPPFPPMHQQR